MTRESGFAVVEPFGPADGKLPAVAKHQRVAFTLIELLVVVAIIAVLVTILVPVVADVLEDGRVAKCMANLSHISKAMNNKMPDNNGNRIFGLIHSDSITATAIEVNTDPLGADDDLTALAAQGKNAMQNVWELVANYEVTARTFQCPSDATTDRASSTPLKYGWTALSEFSYGIQYPYGTYGINDTALKDRTVIMADRNPGGPVDGSTFTHSNHDEGVSVLFYDGNVTFHKANDSLAGYAGDEIYTNAAGTPVPGGAPIDAADTSITPKPSR